MMFSEITFNKIGDRKEWSHSTIKINGRKTTDHFECETAPLHWKQKELTLTG